MADQKLTDILAGLVKANAMTKRPNFNQVAGLSNAILSSAPVANPYDSGAAQNGADARGPSFVNRILDILSRPEYAVLSGVQGAVDRSKANSPTGEPGVLDALNEGASTAGIKDFLSGLSGKSKITGKEILEKNHIGDNMNGPEKALTAFGIDVVADPLTWIDGGGLPGKAAKLLGLKKDIQGGSEALRDVEKGAAQSSQGLADEIAQGAARQARSAETEAPSLADDLLEDVPAKAGKPTDFIDPEDLKAPSVPNYAKTGLKDLAEEEPFPPPPPGFGKSSIPISSIPMPKLLKQIQDIHKQIEGVKSPITKSVLRQQLEKLTAGVKPADLLEAAKIAPPMFPPLTIAPRWIDAARNVAEDFLKNNRIKDINHVGQSNLYNKVLNAATKVRQDRRAFTVFQMLRIAEETVLKNGRHLTDASGTSLRLSDLANIMGGSRALNSKLVDDFRKARPSQLVEDLKSFNTPQVVSDILDPVMQTAKQLQPVIRQLPPSQTGKVASEISKELTKIAGNAGAASKEAKTAKAFIDELFNPERDKLYTKIHAQARSLVRQTTTGVVNPHTMSNISEEVYKTLGANPKILGRQLDQQKVVEGIMTKFATWWGARDLKPFSRQYIDTARNVAAAFAETIRPLVASTTKSQRVIGWAVATGKQSAGSVQEQALADEFSKIAERLLGTHGITDNAEAVVLRSGTVMNELNKELPKEMQFVATKGTDALGRAFDYSKGNWMDSWKEWKSTEPAETLYKLTRSLQLVTRKNAMWDDAAARWGSPFKRAEFQHEASNVARLKGTYFPQQIAAQIGNLHNQLERDVFKTPHKAIELFDKVQRMWKTGVTIYSPSHHIRNLTGDIYLSALDGVVTPKPYSVAMRVLHAFPTRHKDLESVFKIMDPKLRDMALHARPGSVVLTTRNGIKLTAEQLYQAAETQGIFTRATNLEELANDAQVVGSKFRPFNGKVYDAATRVSELREHWVRLAHFTDVISKSKLSLPQAIEAAGQRVRKFHPDGMDLTGFEQNVLRRIIPFYSWMRKATPLVIEGALMHPGITMLYPKAMSDAQELTGIESQGPGNPFPMDQMFPEWLKDKGIGPILGPDSGLGRQDSWRGHAPGDTIVNPSNPFLDQLAQIGNPGQTILGGLSPAARIPLELLKGETSLGIPISSTEGGTPGYLAQQIPALGLAARLSGATRDNEPYNPEQLLNYLTGLGITGTGPYQQQGQMEIRQALTNIANKNRGDYK